MEVHEEIDDSRQKILRRVGEERFRAAFLLTAALVQGGKECSSRFGGSRQVGNVLPLNWIDAVGILHIGKVHDTEPAIFRQFVRFPILAILVEQGLCQCRKLKVIYHQGKPFGGMLTYKRVDDAERLTRTRRTQYNRATERIDDINPALVHLLLPVVYHRYVHRIVIVHQSLRLLERFVLEVEAVIAHLVVVILGNTIQSLMHQHRAHDRTYRIENAVGRKAHPTDSDVHPMEDKAKPDQCQACQYRIDDHRLHVELQSLLRFCTDADHTDTDQFRYLAARYRIENLKSPQQVKDKLRDAVVRRYRQVHDNLNNEKDIDAASEVIVHLLLFLGLFKCHIRMLLGKIKTVSSLRTTSRCGTYHHE